MERINTESNPDSKLESLWIKVKLRNSSIVIGCIYRPPHDTSLTADIEDFEQQYELAAEHQLPVYIMGDFNIDLSVADKPGVKLLCETTSDLDLTQLVQTPTRIATVNRDGQQYTTSTLIDLAFTSTPDDVTKVAVEEHNISDHRCVLLSLRVHRSAQETAYCLFASFRVPSPHSKTCENCLLIQI